MTATLAINGGTPAIPASLSFHTWPPPLDDAGERLILEAIQQNNHSGGGPHVRLLEQEFAAWNGNRHCIATCYGGAALHMCVAGCGVGAGDEVITTALSWTTSATCILHHMAIPIFVDVEWDSMHLDAAKIEAAITDRTKAILVVHYWGVACDMDAIMAIAKKHNLRVIEDACQAHGALYKGRKVGTIGDCGAFSFNQNKNLCGGEGGVFVTDDDAILEKAKAVMSFSDMRPADAGRDYHHYGLGYKYGHANLPSAFALAGLRRLDATNAWGIANWQRLDSHLDGTPKLIRSFGTTDRPSNGYAYVLRVDPAYAIEREVELSALTDGIVAALKAEGTAMSRANWLLPAHGVFQAKNAFGKGSPWTDYARPEIDYSLGQWPVAQDCVDTSLWGINLHRPPNKDAQIDALAGAIRKVFENLDDVPVG
ncbi:MAG: DegT/DnrJ/EryC1/StrS family aminotransferase [Verrucomicrobia bacterium]|nr:DegT/DnrJ/EryC1/StrS family aminotransferase [Verrucomicrobiota bacterium]